MLLWRSDGWGRAPAPVGPVHMKPKCSWNSSRITRTDRLLRFWKMRENLVLTAFLVHITSHLHDLHFKQGEISSECDWVAAVPSLQRSWRSSQWISKRTLHSFQQWSKFRVREIFLLMLSFITQTDWKLQWWVWWLQAGRAAPPCLHMSCESSFSTLNIIKDKYRSRRTFSHIHIPVREHWVLQLHLKHFTFVFEKVSSWIVKRNLGLMHLQVRMFIALCFMLD